jgi:hypothetical protein
VPALVGFAMSSSFSWLCERVLSKAETANGEFFRSLDELAIFGSQFAQADKRFEFFLITSAFRRIIETKFKRTEKDLSAIFTAISKA